MALSFHEAKVYLETEINPNSEEWQYRNVHVNQYANQPWSMTPLKKLFHREVPIGGNTNTPSVSKSGMSKVSQNKIFKGTHVAGYKQVVHFGRHGEQDVNKISIDTGMSGNLFSGKYFSMNEGHLKGELQSVSTDMKALQRDKKNSKLEIYQAVT